jgi:hypothetical protein
MRGSGTMAVQSHNRTQFYHLDGDPGEHYTTERCGETSGRQDRLDRVLRPCAAIVGPAATAAAPSSRGVAAAGCAIPPLEDESSFAAPGGVGFTARAGEGPGGDVGARSRRTTVRELTWQTTGLENIAVGQQRLGMTGGRTVTHH